VESLSEDFKPDKYHDTFQENLRALIEAKQKGKSIMAEPRSGRARVIDMMEALKCSVRNSGAQKQKTPTKLRTTGSENRRRRLAS
jgi:DNA end-binding protein Ku